ncbi:MAG: four helix bundle protein [Cyclobacteriaceae bacterium]
MRNFRDLEIWTLSRSIAVGTYQKTKKFPREEVYGLTSQMRRAAISVPSNISEGCSRNSNKEFIRFLEIAIGSSFELETQLSISLELGFLKREEAEELILEVYRLQSKINSFIKSVKNFH